MKRSEQGFTVIELIAVVILAAVAGVLFFVQKNNVEIAARDDKRKTAINAIYYNLEEVYYPKHKSYPSTLDPKDLSAMDPALLKDTSGIEIGDESGISEYHYEPIDCDNDNCKSYELRTILENEADYVKKSRH